MNTMLERASSSARAESMGELATGVIMIGGRKPDWTWLMRSNHSATEGGPVNAGMGTGKGVGKGERFI